jgi:hypothetical protein
MPVVVETRSSAPPEAVAVPFVMPDMIAASSAAVTAPLFATVPVPVLVPPEKPVTPIEFATLAITTEPPVPLRSET